MTRIAHSVGRNVVNLNGVIGKNHQTMNAMARFNMPFLQKFLSCTWPFVILIWEI